MIAQRYWDGKEWQDVAHSDIARALARATTARAVADGKAKVHFRPSTQPPPAPEVDDLWLQIDTQKIQRFDGNEWKMSTSLEWDDMFGAKKPQNLAANGGSNLIADPTFALQVRGGREAWAYNGREGGAGQQVFGDHGEPDGAGVKMRGFGAGTAEIITSEPFVAPASRWLTLEARVRRSADFVGGFELRSATASEPLKTLNIDSLIPNDHPGHTDWVQLSIPIHVTWHVQKYRLWNLVAHANAGEWGIDELRLLERTEHRNTRRRTVASGLGLQQSSTLAEHNVYGTDVMGWHPWDINLSIDVQGNNGATSMALYVDWRDENNANWVTSYGGQPAERLDLSQGRRRHNIRLSVTPEALWHFDRNNPAFFGQRVGKVRMRAVLNAGTAGLYDMQSTVRVSV